ncbi:MAG: hypothetical protein ACKODH_16950 [Limisphaerales bacterium]
MKTSPSTKSGLLVVMASGLVVCGLAHEASAYVRFDQMGISHRRLADAIAQLESRAKQEEPQLAEGLQKHAAILTQQLDNLGPHVPELRLQVSEQGRAHAQHDVANGRPRLFYVTPSTTGVYEGHLGGRPEAPPLDEFEALLKSRVGARLVRVSECPPGPDYIPRYIAVNTRCDGYNAEIERHLRELHGFDIVAMLWRVAVHEARGTKEPEPTMAGDWRPFAAIAAAFCLLLGLISTRRRREHRAGPCLLQLTHP